MEQLTGFEKVGRKIVFCPDGVVFHDEETVPAFWDCDGDPAPGAAWGKGRFFPAAPCVEVLLEERVTEAGSEMERSKSSLDEESDEAPEAPRLEGAADCWDWGGGVFVSRAGDPREFRSFILENIFTFRPEEEVAITGPLGVELRAGK